ncbi:hypothetical protein Taro_008510, partial [Colocasia esculenta]|nr:hypothetical protein [Colocasia esculenta]
REKESFCEGLIRRLEGSTGNFLRLEDSSGGEGALLTPGDHLCKCRDHIKVKDITFLAWPRRASSPKSNLQRFFERQWRAMVGAVPRLGRRSRDVRRGVSSRPQHPRVPRYFLHHHLCTMAQVPAPVPQEHGHGGPHIMERFKRMALPPFKGESQPLLAESWMREVEKIFQAIRCAEEDKVILTTYML